MFGFCESWKKSKNLGPPKEDKNQSYLSPFLEDGARKIVSTVQAYSKWRKGVPFLDGLSWLQAPGLELRESITVYKSLLRVLYADVCSIMLYHVESCGFHQFEMNCIIYWTWIGHLAAIWPASGGLCVALGTAISYYMPGPAPWWELRLKYLLWSCAFFFGGPSLSFIIADLLSWLCDLSLANSTNRPETNIQLPTG